MIYVYLRAFGQKEGKIALTRTRLSCHAFRDNEVRLQLFACSLQPWKLFAAVGVTTKNQTLDLDHSTGEVDQD